MSTGAAEDSEESYGRSAASLARNSATQGSLMPGHDLKQLSSRDFEELTRDLLQAEWGVALEAFKAGRDQGIDLRHVSTDKGATIVQCKHYAGSGYTKLLAHLRSSELEKVRKLKPKRYVLVTSVELSASNKDTIVELFDPFIVSPNDVKGANDIDGLLQRHSNVVRANFKLWLTSTEVLERVLHNAEVCQTEFAVERVIRKLPIFVQNAAFPRAQDILDKTNVLVISGVPGIGKTTLAEMLLYAHLEQGYEPVVIRTDVREGKNVFNSKRRQVFYFDDFLGQTFLGENRFPGGMNSDMSLVEFVEMTKRTHWIPQSISQRNGRRRDRRLPGARYRPHRGCKSLSADRDDLRAWSTKRPRGNP